MAKSKITEDMGVHKSWEEEAEKQTLETLPEFLRHLTEDYGHDYGTICHAIVAGMMGTLNAIDNSKSGGITGFQANCICKILITKLMRIKRAYQIIEFDNILFPQYKSHFDKTLRASLWKELQEKARECLNS